MAIKLIKDLDFASLINNTNAVTESGKEMLSRYRGYCYNNSVTCAVVNNFINESRNNYTFDDGLMSILEAIEGYISENKTRWELASVSEGIQNNNSAYNVLNKRGVQKVDKLVEMSENDVRSYIKAGVLKDIQYIPEVRNICKGVYGKNVCETKQSLNFTISNPVSYVEMNESGSSFMVNGVVFNIDECGSINVGGNTNVTETFKRINAHLANMNMVGESLEYGYYTGINNQQQNKFTISEGQIDFTNGRVSESFNNVTKFREFVYSDSFAKAMNVVEARKFANIGHAIADVYENFDNVCTLDNVKLFNCSNGAVVAVTESEDMVNVTLFNSFGRVNESKNYDKMKDAVKDMKNNYGLDTETVFASTIAKDIKEGKQTKIDNDDEVNVRLLKIAELSEQFKDDNVKLMILTEMAHELQKMKDA